MGLAYVMLFIMILGGGALAALFFKAAREIWERSRWPFLAAVPLILAALCAAGALYVLAIVWREPPWRFRF